MVCKRLLVLGACLTAFGVAGCAKDKMTGVNYSQQDYEKNFSHPPSVSAAERAQNLQDMQDRFKKLHPDQYDAGGNFKRGAAYGGGMSASVPPPSGK